MRWLAGRPWWLLAGAFVLALLGVVIAWTQSIWLLSGTGVVLLFLLFFATLRALVTRSETRRTPSPH